MDAIEPGALVVAESAYGEWLQRRATSGVVSGHDFPVVWVCAQEEWEAAERDGREPDADPWPAESVKLAGVVG